MAVPFGKYLLESKLAEGGMAEIFLARQAGIEGFERQVVVKRLLPDLSLDDDFVRMFLNEARLAARLSHPNVVQIFELDQEEGAYFLAMEYIRGEDLRGLAQQADAMGRRPSVGLICRILCEVLSGLHYAHTRTGSDGKPLGLVHRDISPQNILVTYDGGVKIIDFGIAKATQQKSSDQTQAGLLKGKYAYMSPEQTRGAKLDGRSDVFSAGILLWELLTWKRLFKRATDLATLVAVSDEPAPPPSQINPEVPEELDPIVLKALAIHPDERYASAKDFQAALEEFLADHNLEADTRALRAYMRELFKDRLAQAEMQAQQAAAPNGARPVRGSQAPVARTRPAPMTMPLQTIDPAARTRLLGQGPPGPEVDGEMEAPALPAAPQPTLQPQPTPAFTSGPQPVVQTPLWASGPQPVVPSPVPAGPAGPTAAWASGPQGLVPTPSSPGLPPREHTGTAEVYTPRRRILIAVASGLIFGLLSAVLLQHLCGLP